MPTPGSLTITGEVQGLIEGSCELEDREGTILVQAFDHVVEIPTDERGIASVSGHDAQFPGIYLGFYRVRISKQVDGKETVPARYNTESELGYEATDDIPEVNNVIQFHLEN